MMKAENDESGANANTLVKPASRKRTISISDEEKKSKIQKVAGEAVCRSSLLNISDDVLLIIMSYLDAIDLMSLRLSCSRLADVASDWSLWTSVNLGASMLLESELLEYIPVLRDTTESLAIRGFMSCYPSPKAKTQCLSKALLSDIKKTCPSLKSFVVKEHYIDAFDIKVSYFPSSLKHWSLKGSKIVNLPESCSYFLDIHLHMPNLQRTVSTENCLNRELSQLVEMDFDATLPIQDHTERKIGTIHIGPTVLKWTDIRVLELTDCTWMPSHSILALSKLPHLQELRLNGCKRLRDCIAYISLAFNMGFSKLQVLDLRRTGFSDSELPSINRWNRLTHVYLELYANAADRGGPPSPGASSDEEWDNVADVLHPPTVSDSGIWSLVSSTRNDVLNHVFGFGNNEIVVSAPVKNGGSRCGLHTLVARHYPSITDCSLGAVRSVSTLSYLDLTGTGITEAGAAEFRQLRPDVTLVTSFDNVT